MAKHDSLMTLHGLAAELSAIHGELEESGGELTPEIERRLDEWGAAFPVKVSSIASYLKFLEWIEDRCKDQESRIRDVRKRIERRGSRLRSYLLRCMAAAGVRSVKPEDGSQDFRSVRVSTGRKGVRIVDASLLPPDLVERVVTLRPKVAQIGELLEAGLDVPGASLERSEDYISIGS